MSANSFPVIAIDGPSASGKGSVAERVANKLGYLYLDSGALYRIVALAAMHAGIKWDNGRAIGALVPTLNIVFKNSQVYLNDKTVTDAIRTPEMSNGASKVAVHPEVRHSLLALQHSFRQAPGLVADGRDMASVVFADAKLKIFLTASVDTRTDRRYQQLLKQGIKADFDKILADLKARDLRDRSRDSAPLLKTEDAILLDTDDKNIDEAVAFVLKAYQNHQNSGN